MANHSIPAFEFQDWTYQSFLVLPNDEELSGTVGTGVTARKWAMGRLRLSDSPDGYEANGFLDFRPGVQLRIPVKGVPGKDGIPATFAASGVDEDGVTKGSEYQLMGWAFAGTDGKAESVWGSVRAVCGPDSSPGTELGRMPVGTVGSFTITKTS
jgi:hypothetical protein